MGRKEIIMYNKKTRDFNAAECMIWMYKYNSGKIDIYMHGDYPRYLISLVPIAQLEFPDGWHYSEETKSLNKEHSIITIRITHRE